jgi:glycosyltransferase involved in cell wall biosynthesis
MCHAYFVASIVSIFFKKLRIIWNIRQLDMDARINRWTTRAIIKICSYLSKYSPCRIVYCAQSGARFYESIGYDSSKTIVLSNGFDLSIFKPDASKYVAFRKQLGLKEGVLVVGIVARFNVAKDYHTFIQAATLVARQMENVVFVCCGHNVDWKNVVLSQWIKEMTLEKKVYLFGLCNEVQDIMVAFDILVSSSISEAFSNVIGEAMSCGVPCVATDVGDSSIIIGNKDYIVPPQRPELLAQAIIKILHMNNEERKLLQVAVRERIAQRYSLVRVVEQYENLYYQMINS